MAKKVYIHSMLGIQIPDFSALNTELVNNGYMKLNSTYFSRGGGFYTVFPKAHIATMFNYTTYTANKTKGSSTNSLRGTSVGTSLGIVLWNKPTFQIIPFGGVVYNWFGVRLSKNNIPNQTFNNYLAGGLNQQHIATEGFTGNIGLHLSAMPFRDARFGKNINIGLRPGYYLPLNNTTKWTTNGNNLKGGPGINAQGFYCNFIFGIAL